MNKRVRRKAVEYVKECTNCKKFSCNGESCRNIYVKNKETGYVFKQ